jgi:hypothetical protein
MFDVLWLILFTDMRPNKMDGMKKLDDLMRKNLEDIH